MKMEIQHEDSQETLEDNVELETVYMYTCGGCNAGFDTAYMLHDHIQQHIEGGSYYYDHILRIAYPKYDTFCRMVQTDFHDCEGGTIDGENVGPDAVNVDGVDLLNTVGATPGYKQEMVLETISTKDTGNGSVNPAPRPAIRAEPVSKILPKTTGASTQRKRRLRVLKKSQVAEVPISNGKIKLCSVCGKKFQRDKHLHDHIRNQHKPESGQLGLGNRLQCSQCGKLFVRMDHLIHHTNSSQCARTSCNTNSLLSEDTGMIDSAADNNDGGTEATVSNAQVETSGVSSSMTNRKNRRISVKEESQATRKMKHLKTMPRNGAPLSIRKDFPGTTSKGSPGIIRNASPVPIRKGATVRPRTKIKKDKSPAACDECGLVIPCYKMDVHSRVHTGDRPYTCPQCGKGLISEMKLRRHLLLHSKLRPHVCSECDATFTARYKLQIHLNSHRGIKPHLCPICGAEFGLSSNLARHIKCIHVGDKCFKCDQCSSRFVRKSQLTTHLLSHTSERTLTCRYCGKQFKYRQGLRRHEKLHTMPEGGEHVCDACGHSFSRKDNLERHKQVHLESNIKCRLCSKKFRHEKSLVEHEKLHKHAADGVDPAPVPGEEHMTVPVHVPISVQVYLKPGVDVTDIALQPQLPDRPEIGSDLQCTHCTTTFSDTHSLETHEQTHFDKLYSCRFCTMAFLGLKHLTEHEASHVDGVTYYCGDCSQKFESEILLDEHSRAVHGGDEGEFHCPLCRESFNNNEAYISHMQLRHLDSREQTVVATEREHLLTIPSTAGPLQNTVSLQVDEGTQFDGSD